MISIPHDAAAALTACSGVCGPVPETVPKLPLWMPGRSFAQQLQNSIAIWDHPIGGKVVLRNPV